MAETSAEIWRAIRSLRANPPGAAAGPAAGALTGRRAVFSAALEQSEQLFTAAAGNPYNIRPMLLFYGMSQASRALAAASTHPALQVGDAWRLRGHGLTCPDDAIRPENLAEVTVRRPGPGRSTFSTTQVMLDSPEWQPGVDVELGALFAAHPDLREFRGRTDWMILEAFPNAEPVTASSPPQTRITGYSLRVTDPRTWDRRLEIPEQYGFLHGATVTVDYPALPADEVPQEFPWLYSVLQAAIPVNQQVITQQQPTNPSVCLTPNLAGATGQQQPFVLWWAVLFVLSMRARYEPEGWTRDLDPDRSEYAVILEEVLTDALTTCPSLIFDAIDQVIRPPS